MGRKRGKKVIAINKEEDKEIQFWNMLESIFNVKIMSAYYDESGYFVELEGEKKCRKVELIAP
jgi:hypothetical protein